MSYFINIEQIFAAVHMPESVLKADILFHWVLIEGQDWMIKLPTT